MNTIITIVLSVVASIFSTAVMSYISMAMPIGPWIAPTLALGLMLIFKIIGYQLNSRTIALITSAGSIGGILATGIGFSFPTLYFLDQSLFNTWMLSPFFFSAALAGLSLAAGGLGIWFANILVSRLVDQEQLAFPIGQLVYKMIAVHQHMRKAYELVIGFVSTAFLCFLQDGLWRFKGFIPKNITLLSPIDVSVLHLPLLRLDIWPMVWAIGFIMGPAMIIPLAVGAIAKIAMVDPLNELFFSYLSSIEFILAFCSGMVLYSALISFIDLPNMIMRGVKTMKQRGTRAITFDGYHIARTQLIELILVGVIIVAFLSYFSYSWIVQLYLVFFTLICTYQIAVIAGKIGLAPLGRFATFVMVPAMVLFPLDLVQIVFIATFVEICGGVAADVLFSQKMGQLAHVDQNMIRRYQYGGLIMSTLCVGVIFWLLINHLQLGSPELCAYKAQSRQLLISAQQFDYYVLLIGIMFGFVLKFFRINPMLVLGGLLMPLNLTIGLVLGGLLTLLTKDRTAWEPFWSGVFASNSLWMIIKSIL